MDLPKPMLDAARLAAEAHPDDIERATEAAFLAVRRMENYESLVGHFVRLALREKVYALRHAANVRIRAEARALPHAGPAKIDQASPAASRAYRSVYGYHVAGTTLGALLGEDLERVAAAEASRASGHSFNARLLRLISPRVAPEQTVRQALSERQLRRYFREAGEGAEPAAV